MSDDTNPATVRRWPSLLTATALGALALLPRSTHAASSPPAGRDRIELHVTATDTVHAVFAVHEVIPVREAGDLVLLYPQWETASHAPTIPVQALAGLIVTIDGRRGEWRRDAVAMHAFHVPVPAGTHAVVADFQILSDRDSLRDGRVDAQWQRLLLYPAGRPVAAITVMASLTLPAGVRPFTALDWSQSGDTMRFAPTSLDRLVDTPVWAARASRRLALTSGKGPPVHLDLLADDPADLAMSDGDVRRHAALVEEAGRVFGPAPFSHYDMLVRLDGRASGGVEHLQEGENGLPDDYARSPAKELNSLDLVAHEYVHAWNGRFRLPADMAVPSYNRPVANGLLWVYEGQTEFWGRVLAARAGLRTGQQTLDQLALDAALVAYRPGRAWKSLADSTNDPVYMAGRHVGWRDWARREDYYPEGVLLWLDVDAHLRELTAGRSGLDAFAAAFFKAGATDAPVSAYTYADVAAALDRVAHDDWDGFLSRHLTTHDTADAMAGLGRAGWRLDFTPTKTETFRQAEADDGGCDMTYSIGLKAAEDGGVAAVAWDGPAFRADLAAGDRIVAVDGAPFSTAALERGVAATPTVPLTLAVAAGKTRRLVRLSYTGGLRYPTLGRIESAPDRLTPLLTPRASMP